MIFSISVSRDVSPSHLREAICSVFSVIFKLLASLAFYVHSYYYVPINYFCSCGFLKTLIRVEKCLFIERVSFFFLLRICIYFARFFSTFPSVPIINAFTTFVLRYLFDPYNFLVVIVLIIKNTFLPR